MTDLDGDIEDSIVEPPISSQEVIKAKEEIDGRCKAVGFSVEEVVSPGSEPALKVGIRCGRDIRWCYLGSDEAVVEFSSVAFERYVFLSEYEAICSYQDGFIEASLRPQSVGFAPHSFAYRKLFGLGPGPGFESNLKSIKHVLESPQNGFPRIEISQASPVFTALVRAPMRQRLTFKLTECKVSTHDQAVALLKKTSGSVLFQIDLLSDISIGLERERRRSMAARKPPKKVNLANDLQYPKTEFDDAPLSLYWYARSASGMPLLQFLAFYQVIEFYFPIYSQAEAQRKLKAILKDPTFRGDRDADIGKLLSSIHITRSGAYGDERSQIRATLMECVHNEALRQFLESDPERKEFYSAKSKTSPYHRIPLANPSTDLRGDVAERIYDIRCKIVHMKNDSREGEVELLLPFSKEAEQLSLDIELAQFIAQSALIAGSLPFTAGG